MHAYTQELRAYRRNIPLKQNEVVRIQRHASFAAADADTSICGERSLPSLEWYWARPMHGNLRPKEAECLSRSGPEVLFKRLRSFVCAINRAQ